MDNSVSNALPRSNAGLFTGLELVSLVARKIDNDVHLDSDTSGNEKLIHRLSIDLSHKHRA
jgi:hypothetical protein